MLSGHESPRQHANGNSFIILLGCRIRNISAPSWRFCLFSLCCSREIQNLFEGWHLQAGFAHHGQDAESTDFTRAASLFFPFRVEFLSSAYQSSSSRYPSHASRASFQWTSRGVHHSWSFSGSCGRLDACTRTSNYPCVCHCLHCFSRH